MNRENELIDLARLIASREIPKRVFRKYIGEDSPLANADVEDVYNYLVGAEPEEEVTVGDLHEMLNKYDNNTKVSLMAKDSEGFYVDGFFNIYEIESCCDGEANELFISIENAKDYEEEED